MPGQDGGPDLDIGREAAREAAERELSREIYTQHEPNIIQRFVDWAWDHLSSLLDGLGFQPPGGWAGLLLLTAIVVALVVALRLRFGAFRTAVGTGRKPLFPDGPRSAADHRAAADAHAARGDWTAATQERMRALVRSLEERTVLDPRPGRTADEAATETGAAVPDLAHAVREAAHTFDAITYGDAQASAADHDRITALDEALRRVRAAHGREHQDRTTGGAAQ